MGLQHNFTLVLFENTLFVWLYVYIVILLNTEVNTKMFL